MSDEFWGREDTDPEVRAGGAEEPECAPITPGAQTALVGFLTAGLPGLLGAFDARDGASFESEVDDPEALRAAEDAVAREGRGERGGGPSAVRIDEPWAIVATQNDPADTFGLDEVVGSLRSEGIDTGWDPYDPRDVVGFTPPSAGLTARKLFSVLVPASQAASARDCLGTEAPHGVTYPWTAADWSQREAPGPEAGAEDGAPDEYGFVLVTSAKRPVSPDGRPLSDNVHAQRMADGGTPGGTWILVLATCFVLVVAVAFLVLRG